MATFLPPSSMESLSILAFAVAVLDSSDESSSTLKEPPPGREWSFDGSVKETSWPSSRVSIVGAWYQSLLFAPMKMVSIRVLGLPFQPEDVVRDRAGTTAAQSFRCLSDEQNMAAHRIRFDNAAFSGSGSNRRILVSFIGLQGTGMACNRSHVWTCKSVQLIGGQSIRTELHEQTWDLLPTMPATASSSPSRYLSTISVRKTFRSHFAPSQTHLQLVFQLIIPSRPLNLSNQSIC